MLSEWVVFTQPETIQLTFPPCLIFVSFTSLQVKAAKENVYSTCMISFTMVFVPVVIFGDLPNIYSLVMRVFIKQFLILYLIQLS